MLVVLHTSPNPLLILHLQMCYLMFPPFPLKQIVKTIEVPLYGIATVDIDVHLNKGKYEILLYESENQFHSNDNGDSSSTNVSSVHFKKRKLQYKGVEYWNG